MFFFITLLPFLALVSVSGSVITQRAEGELKKIGIPGTQECIGFVDGQPNSLGIKDCTAATQWRMFPNGTQKIQAVNPPQYPDIPRVLIAGFAVKEGGAATAEDTDKTSDIPKNWEITQENRIRLVTTNNDKYCLTKIKDDGSRFLIESRTCGTGSTETVAENVQIWDIRDP